jgi:hypothetical protein
MVSILGLDLQYIILIIGVVLLISLIFFRRYFSALIYDFVVDPLLSFADNFIAGAGLIGLDFGDWIAAFLIFKKEKKITGGPIAMFAAWEATNFLPISLIPVVGEAVEIFFNFFPAVFISRVLFNKFRPAEKKEHKLENEISIAETLGIKVSKEKKVLKDVQKLIRKSDPVDALKKFKSKKPVKEVSSKIREYVDNLIAETNGIIQYIEQQNVDVPQYLINILQGGIYQSGKLLEAAKQAENDEENPDFEAAVNYAVQAKEIIMTAANEFDQGYQNAMQNQAQGQLEGA